MIAAVQHDQQAANDYRLLRNVGIRTARDGLRWHLIDRAGQYDFSSLAPMVKAAEQNKIQIIWDLCHYGWPEDVPILAPAFVDRFARFCEAAACFIRDHSDQVPFYTPINEISFLAWAATRNLIYPYAYGRDSELKAQLIRAVIAASEAIWTVDARARLVTAEPVIHLVPPRGAPELAAMAAARRASQFEAWDMLSGRIHPELGGNSRYLDIVGVNYYCSNQWEYPGGRKLCWDGSPQDERWLPLHQLLEEIYNRYKRPFFIAETSHYGTGRAAWLREVANEVYQARLNGVPVQGVCLYPILDRYDWEDPTHWHNSGLWDLVLDRNGNYRRVLNQQYAAELGLAQALLAKITSEAS